MLKYSRNLIAVALLFSTTVRMKLFSVWSCRRDSQGNARKSLFVIVPIAIRRQKGLTFVAGILCILCLNTCEVQPC